MRKELSAEALAEVAVSGREVRVERRFSSERKTRDMLQGLIRAHIQPV